MRDLRQTYVIRRKRQRPGKDKRTDVQFTRAFNDRKKTIIFLFFSAFLFIRQKIKFFSGRDEYLTCNLQIIGAVARTYSELTSNLPETYFAAKWKIVRLYRWRASTRVIDPDYSELVRSMARCCQRRWQPDETGSQSVFSSDMRITPP
jgi:hypothetical protein